MVNSVGTVVLKVAELFLMIGVGVVCARMGMLTRRGVSQLTSLLLYIVAPCLIVASLSGQHDDIESADLGLAFGLAIGAHLLAIGISQLLFSRQPDGVRRVLRFAAVYSNTGFMGLPLVQAVVGESGVVYASIFMAVFNVFVWTHGFGLMSGGKRWNVKKILLNPGVLALLIGLPLFFFCWELPELIAVPVDGFAALNTPLAMIVIGCSIARIRPRELFCGKTLFALCGVRLLFIPAVFLAAGALVCRDPVLLVTCVIQASAPVAANTVLFATQFGGDSRLAARLVAATTLFSVVTMPLFVVISQWLCGGA